MARTRAKAPQTSGWAAGRGSAAATRGATSGLQALADAGRGARLAPLQRLADRRATPIQRLGVEEEEPLQGKKAGGAGPAAAQGPAPATPAPSAGAMPDALRAGVESLSGVSLDGVRVHRGSPEPAAVGAHAFARGADIHVAAGREDALPHEAWHVVQQAQGRVRPTTRIAGQPVNDDPALEREADAMGAAATQRAAAGRAPMRRP